MTLAPSSVGRDFRNDRQGTVAVTVAIGLVPMLLAAGVAIDYARGQQFKSALQSAVDAAALAGAAAYVDNLSASSATIVATNSITAALPHLPPSVGPISTTQTAGNTTTSGGAQAYSMTVGATAKVATTLIGMFTASSNMVISVTATAINPATKAQVGLGNFTSTAWDRNMIYWYIVPSDGSLPTLDPTHLIYSNAPGYNNSSPSVPVAQSSQRIGFALYNITDGNQNYGTNSYGYNAGSIHVFYSHLTFPSSVAYPQVHQNCNLVVATVTDPNNPPQPPTNNICYASSPTNAAPTCSELAGATLKFMWDDMGGPTDDHDYTNAEYTISCSPSGGSGTGPTGVTLVQ